MTNTFQTIIGKLEKGNNLEFVGEIFSNEILLDESPQCSILGEITFFDVEFRKVDFTGSNFVGCKFKNCRLKNIIFRKCEFWNSTFENCQIEKCDFTRVAFYNDNFRNCNFLYGNLRANDFSDFEFIETKFKNSNLDLIIVRSIKLWKSNQSTEIEKFSNFEKILKDLDLISNDQIQNYDELSSEAN